MFVTLFFKFVFNKIVLIHKHSHISSTAFAFIYLFLVLAIFISFHILSVFWAVVFPFHASSFKTKGYLKYVHLTMLLLALILPWGAVTVVFAKGSYRRFPPITCYPRPNSVNLYGLTWPICIMLAVDLSLIAIVFWILIRLLQKKRRQQGRKVNFNINSYRK